MGTTGPKEPEMSTTVPQSDRTTTALPTSGVTSLEIPYDYTEREIASLLESLGDVRDQVGKLSVARDEEESHIGEIVTKLPGLNSLKLRYCDLSNPHSIAFFAGLGRLESLTIQGCGPLPLAEILANLPHLRHLKLDETTTKDGDLRSVADLPLLETLKIYRSPLENLDLYYIAKLPSLETLSIGNCHSVTSIGLLHLASMVRLRRLSVRKCNFDVVNLWFLHCLPNLVELRLESIERLTGHLQELSMLSNLKRMDLRECHHLETLAYITTIPHLESLNISGCDRITTESLMIVAGMPNLRELTAAWNNAINDVSLLRMAEVWDYFAKRRGILPTGVVPRLELLDITLCKRVTDVGIRALEHLKGLRVLRAYGCDRIGGGGIVAISNLHQLEVLDITGWVMTGPSLQLLAMNREELRELHLTSGRLTHGDDLRPLARLHSLEVLGIHSGSHGERCDFSFLGLLTGLRKLHIGGNCTSTGRVDFLRPLTGLRELSITYDSTITNEGLEAVATLPELRELDLSCCDGLTKEGVAVLATCERLQSITLDDFEVPDSDGVYVELGELRLLMPKVLIKV